MRACPLLVLLGAGCLPHSGYFCSDHEDCNVPDGRCEPINRCSVKDSACATGWRYDDSAASLANECVTYEVPGTCPRNSTPLLRTGHYYLPTGSSEPWDEARQRCLSFAPKAFLAVPKDPVELKGLSLLAGSSSRFWIGIDDAVTEGVYIDVTGSQAYFLPWDSGEPSTAPAADCVVAGGAAIASRFCVESFPAICECEP